MNKEKVFWLLDIESIEGLKDSTNYPWKFFCIFDICISVGIVLFGLITGYLGSSVFHVICVTAILATAALFAFCLRFSSKLTLIVPCTSLIPCASALKLFYGYWMFSINEFNEKGYSFFSWLHATILIFALSLFFLLIFSQIKIYKDARKMSFDELTNRTERTKANATKLVKAHPWIRIFPLILPSPYIACKLLKRGEIGEGLGMGFGMWVLACCYIIFISMYLPKFFIYAKYRKLILGTENNHSENN
jgi:hypothetical protein